MNSKTQIQDEAVDAYATQLLADGRAESTTAQRLRHVRALLSWLRERGCGVPGSGDVARYFARPEIRRLSPSTVNTMKTSVRDFLSRLHRLGEIPGDPSRLLRRTRCPAPPPRALLDGERERLVRVLAGAPLRDRTLFALMLRCGLRIGSAANLDVSDVREGVLDIRRGKGGAGGRVPVPRDILGDLQALARERGSGPLFASRSGRRLTTRHIQRLFARYAKAAGVAPSGTHRMRHTFATALYRLTGDLLLVQRALLHRSVLSTAVYARACDDRLREAMGA